MPGSPATPTRRRRPARASDHALAPDELRLVDARQRVRQRYPLLRGRAPEDLARRDRLRESLQRKHAKRREAKAAARADDGTDELGGEHLAARGPVAEALGDDHGSPEPVVLFAERLAEVQSDPDAERLVARASVVPIDHLLDRDRAPDRVDRAPEDDHQAVAEVLHLGAAVPGEDVAEKAELDAAQPLRLVVTQDRELLGRADEIGEEERHHARRACVLRWRVGVRRRLSATARVSADGAIRSSVRRRSCNRA
jgi:hypothetical protein